MPLGDWFANLDALLARSPTLFAERAVILDLAGMTPVPAPQPAADAPAPEAPAAPATSSEAQASPEVETSPEVPAASTPVAASAEAVPAEPMPPAVEAPEATAPTQAGPDIGAVLAELERRGIRIMGIERADPSWLVPGLPPLLAGGRPADATTVPVPPAPPVPAPEKRKPSSLVLESPVRSGQCIYHPEGDVTVMGSVASGAEILAGGSIHVYGTLRGRAIAGAGGNPRARIYCRRFQPELLGIDGLFRTADTTDPKLRDKPVQVWLESDALRMAPLD
ncbi:septum formation inhibitor MinC [Methylobacterium oryzihabitans]|uniref:Probable septum site-determining protein MinC n=2 Tax=Methylobacterium oryzihabitans TaxID=2499852 RepID=A0A437NYJ1_9HYPH|nr:septum site-determining protein MinC [Methylobacterium oryzihabitans]RVU15101.1 septum formation inhibitor MinC [Methylobacterium oryzihabitans]